MCAKRQNASEQRATTTQKDFLSCLRERTALTLTVITNFLLG